MKSSERLNSNFSYITTIITCCLITMLQTKTFEIGEEKNIVQVAKIKYIKIRYDVILFFYSK